MKKDNSTIVSLGEINLNDLENKSAVDTEGLPILPTRNLVLFPGVTIPISLGRDNSLTTTRLAQERHIPIGVLCQRTPDKEEPRLTDDFYEYGVVADVLKVIDLPDGTHSAIVHSREKFEVQSASDTSAIPEAGIAAKVKIIKDSLPRANDKEFEPLVQSVKDTTISILESTAGSPEDFLFNLRNMQDPIGIINLIATHVPVGADVKMRMLKKNRIKERAFILLSELATARQLAQIQQSIMERTQATMTEQQRNNFLQHQMDTIREELYGDSDDATKLEERAKETALSEDARRTFEREVDKLRRLNPQSPDYAVQYTYLDTILALPWEKYEEENKDFSAARDILDANHYGLTKVKERILEQIAVIMNYPAGKAPILCLVGAPGVGKTSLGQSVAKSMGRAYQRVSLGGLHDEAEIRGHRRTYIGAMPGRIMEAIRRAGSSNPVLLLDEIDKIGADFKGDPAAAMLEVLDPEQNCHFHDNYIDIDYDLSKVLFIATANTLSTLSQPLLDRMEIIDIAGYLMEEKVEIALHHLLPKLLKEHNLPPESITMQPATVTAIIEGYTSESGVRQLEKALAQIIRKIILKKMSGEECDAEIRTENLHDYLGIEKYSKDRYEGNEFAGVVTGLAWTAVGGEILYIESSLSEGKGEKLTLTGNLGQVMKESAVIALQYVKANAARYGIDPALFDKYNLHIHVPEGAIPKDGPSAGITMVTSIVSAFKQTRVKERVAMTGEITLRGKILPVGGIKEKILAAKRAGITDIIISADNRKDVEDIEPLYRQGLTFHYVTTIPEAISIAVTDKPVADARSL